MRKCGNRDFAVPVEEEDQEGAVRPVAVLDSFLAAVAPAGVVPDLPQVPVDRRAVASRLQEVSVVDREADRLRQVRPANNRDSNVVLSQARNATDFVGFIWTILRPKCGPCAPNIADSCRNACNSVALLSAEVVVSVALASEALDSGGLLAAGHAADGFTLGRA